MIIVFSTVKFGCCRLLAAACFSAVLAAGPAVRADGPDTAPPPVIAGAPAKSKVSPGTIWKMLTHPELTLPAMLNTLKQRKEWAEFGIDADKMAAEIKAHPEKFRVPVPEHKRQRFLLLTPELELELGNRVAALQEKEMQFSDDAGAVARVAGIAGRLRPQFPEVPVRPVKVVVAKEVNAFCLLNGCIYVNTGLLQDFGADDDILAFVLAHELAHAAARHANELITKNLLVMAGMSWVESTGQEMENNGKKASAALLMYCSLGAGIIGERHYSRTMENEADTIAIRRMTRAGFSPYGAVRFFELLGGHAQNPFWLRFLDTHPTDKKRLKRMQKECGKLCKQETGVK